MVEFTQAYLSAKGRYSANALLKSGSSRENICTRLYIAKNLPLSQRSLAFVHTSGKESLSPENIMLESVLCVWKCGSFQRV